MLARARVWLKSFFQVTCGCPVAADASVLLKQELLQQELEKFGAREVEVRRGTRKAGASKMSGLEKFGFAPIKMEGGNRVPEDWRATCKEEEDDPIQPAYSPGGGSAAAPAEGSADDPPPALPSEPESAEIGTTPTPKALGAPTAARARGRRRGRAEATEQQATQRKATQPLKRPAAASKKLSVRPAAAPEEALDDAPTQEWPGTNSFAGAGAEAEEPAAAAAAASPPAEQPTAAEEARPAPADGGEFRFGYEEGERKPTCQKCKRTAKQVNFRLHRKSSNTWLCAGCNTRGTALIRQFGSWPPVSFQLMKKDWQESFWREVSDGKFDNSQQLEAHVIEKITMARRERHISRKGGDYLPLSRWRTLGYDVDAVMANDDKKWNGDLKCWCYRVCIESQYDENIEEAVREELHRQSRKTPSKSPTGGASSSKEAATAGDKGKKDRSRSKEAATANDQKEKSRSRSKACSDKKGRSKEAAAAGDRKNNRSRSRKAERSSSEKRGGSSSKKRGRSSSKKRGRSSSKKRGRSSSKKRGRSSSKKRGRSRSQKKNDKDRSRSKKNDKDRSRSQKKNDKGRSTSKNKSRSRSRRNKGRSKSRRGRSRHPG